MSACVVGCGEPETFNPVPFVDVIGSLEFVEMLVERGRGVDSF